MIKIGIDLATRKTGYAILIENNIIKYGVININQTDIKKSFFEEIKKTIISELEKLEENKVMVGIELSTHGNVLLQKKFAILAGMLISILFESKKNIEIKLFDSNEWFKFVTKDITFLERKERKEISIKNIINLFNLNLTDDEADAINIAYFLENCRDFENIKMDTINKLKQKKKEKLDRKKTEIKKLKSKLEYEKYANKLAIMNKKPTKTQIEKLERLKKEYE